MNIKKWIGKFIMVGALFLLSGCEDGKSFDKSEFLTKEAHEKFQQELFISMNNYSNQIKYEIVHEIMKQIDRIKQVDQTSETELLSSLLADIFELAASEIERKLVNEKAKRQSK